MALDNNNYVITFNPPANGDLATSTFTDLIGDHTLTYEWKDHDNAILTGSYDFVVTTTISHYLCKQSAGMTVGFADVNLNGDEYEFSNHAVLLPDAV
jgi:hypothetical protein